LTKDDGEDQQLTLNTAVKVGMQLDYDKLTTAKTFQMNTDGITYTSGTTSFNTPLERLAALKTALSAVELPPNSSTFSVNKNIQMNYTTDNNIILDEASNDIDYPLSNPVSDFQTRITKNSSDNVDICQLGEVSFTKNIVPSYDINNLVVNNTILLDVSNNLPVTTPASNFNTAIRALFKENNKVIWAANDGSATPASKIIYIQDFNSSNMLTVDLNSLTTGADLYIAQLANISIMQIFPISYTSATQCEFLIRLGVASSAGPGLYIIRCNGDPTQLSSYRYSSNWVASGTPIVRANGSSILPLDTVTLGQGRAVARLQIANYINGYIFILSAATGTRWFQIFDLELTGQAAYVVDYTGLTPAVSNPANPILHGYSNTSAFASSFNNNNTGATGSSTVNWLFLKYFDPSNNTLTISQPYNLLTDIPNQRSDLNYRWDSYTIEVGGLLYFYYFYINTTSLTDLKLSVAWYSWDKTTSSTINYLGTKDIQTLGNIPVGSNQIIYAFFDLKVLSLNNIEIYSSFNNGTNTANMFVSNDGLTNIRTISIPNYLVGVLNTGQVELDSTQQVAGNFAVIYPQHAFLVGPTASTISTISSVNLLTVDNPSQSVEKYLTFNHNLATSSTTQTYLYPTTIDASNIAFTTLPTCSVVPTTNNQLVNKAYVDGLSPSAPTLSSVLATGNSADIYNIDMSGNQLLNCSQITATGDLVLNPVGSIDCNGKTIDLTNGRIHNCDHIEGPNNINLDIEAFGTGNIEFITDASNSPVIIIGSDGSTSFTFDAPICDIAPSAGNRLTNKTYVDSNFVGLSGNQTVAGNKTFSGITTLARNIEATQTATGASTITFDYSASTAGIIYIASPPAANFTFNITNLPSLANGTYTFNLLINSSTNKTYASTVQLAGATQTLFTNGGSAGISVTSALRIMQTINIVYSGSTVVAVLNSVSQWY
jgi:hypothetical protein